VLDPFGSDPVDQWHPKHPNTLRRRCRPRRSREGRPHRRRGVRMQRITPDPSDRSSTLRPPLATSRFC